MELENNNHSVFLLYFHHILVVKSRRNVIDKNVSARLKEISEYIAPNYNLILVEWNDDMDHIHILCKAHPNSSLSKFINAYKSASSRIVKKEFSNIREKLWKEYFWSRSFCLLTTGGVTIDLVKQYIVSQGDVQ